MLTKALEIDRLSAADLPAALGLSAEAGWNQTEADWRIFLDHGTVFAVRAAGHPVATAAILPYGAIAWISMVLVTASHRQKGLGSELLRHCVAALRDQGRVPYLDATPAGEKVYLPLGFRAISDITRWQGQGAAAPGTADARASCSEADTETCFAIDAASFGARREPLLRSFVQRSPALACHRGGGFVVARSGRLATQIGPLAARDEAEALRLLRTALDRATGPVFLDVPDRWTDIRHELETRKFTIQRSFRRMALGTTKSNGDPSRSFVIAGPEFG